MLTLRRMTRTTLSLILLAGSFAFSCHAGNTTSYSERYTCDLEEKQTLLESVSECCLQPSKDIDQIRQKMKVIEKKIVEQNKNEARQQ